MFVIGRLYIVKMFILYKAVYRFNIILSKPQRTFFSKAGKNSKLHIEFLKIPNV